MTVKSILVEHRSYKRVVLFAALQGKYDFEADYAEYVALADADAKVIKRMRQARTKELGITFKQVKFVHVKREDKNPEKVKGSYSYAAVKYAKAKQDYYSDPDVIKSILAKAPTHLTHETGKQGDRKKEGTLTAHYSKERPRKVETPFGTETDNQEIFEQ